VSDTTKKLYLEAHGKDYFTGIILAVVLGPLGLMYTNVWASIVLIFVTVAISAATMGYGVLLCWAIAIVAAGPLVSSHNKKVLATAMLLDRVS
jgi:hypothetical protein